jgi:hypothetical protein
VVLRATLALVEMTAIANPAKKTAEAKKPRPSHKLLGMAQLPLWF